MTIVKELNDLAEKMTGTNPNKKTIAKVLDYIEQNYTAGEGSGSGGGSSANELRVDVEYGNDGLELKTDWSIIEAFISDTTSTKVPTLYEDNIYQTNMCKVDSESGDDHFLMFTKFEYEGTEASGNFLIYVYEVKESSVTQYTRLISTEEY